VNTIAGDLIGSIRPDGTARIDAPARATAAGVVAAILGRPRWVNGRALSTTNNAAAAIAEAYRARGAALLDELHGSFAVAIYDSNERRGLIAIDRMGIEQLAYATLADGTLIFGTNLRELVKTSPQSFPLSLQALYDFSFLHVIPAPDTVFAGVQKLPAASLLSVDSAHRELRRYWTPAFAHGAAAPESAMAQHLQATLQRAVEDCAPREDTGTFLSGGIDSSTVTGMLSRIRPHSPSFSIGFEAAGFDEMAYARIASIHFHSRAHEYYVTPADIVTAIPLIAQAYDEPFANSSAVPTYFCARLAHDNGVSRLLAGDGGDELFGGNERYAKQKVFEYYWGLPAAVRRGLVDPVALHLPQSVWPLRKMRSYVEQARVAMPRRLHTWNFLYRTPAESVFERDFLAAVDPSHLFSGMQTLYDSAPTTDLIDRMLYFDWQVTLADNDLRKVNRMCQLAGIEVLYPMLDDRVVELSTQIPPHWKVRGQTLRWFYKRAMSDFLPRRIIEKSKHGFGLPFGQWLKESKPLQDTVYSSVAMLADQRLVRREFLDTLIRDHRDGHAGFYGYMIWMLVTLSHWLHSRKLRV
jgi:asparagine synthase (glutamine-hydrolysing)